VIQIFADICSVRLLQPSFNNAVARFVLLTPPFREEKMACPNLAAGDLITILGYLVSAAKAEQCTRGPVRMVTDTIRSVGEALHIPVGPSPQKLTPTQKLAKSAYDRAIHIRNHFDGYGTGAISLAPNDAVLLIKLYIYLDQNTLTTAARTDLGKAATLLNNTTNDWTNEIANVRNNYDGQLP
jgi:hypothetical protein